MFSKRKLTTMAMLTLLTASLLVGCSDSSKSKGEVGAAEEVLANQNAREAIAMSIDKESLCDVILNNGSVPMDRFTAVQLAFNDGEDYAKLTEEMGYSYNMEEAKKSWEKAKEEVGFETVELEVLTYDNDSGKKLAEFLQAQLSELDGLNLNILNLPFQQKLERESKGEFDLSFAGWGADYPDPLTFLATMQTGNQFAKQVGYDNEKYNELVKEASLLPTPDAFEKYAEAEKIMLDEAFIVPIYQKATLFLEKDYVSGIIKNSWGSDYTYTYADVDKPEKVLNLSTSSDIPTLDISKATDQVSFQTFNTTMEGLTRIDEDGKVQPGVAESWSVSEDGLTWTFKLRENSSWSNGTPVTAHDFEYSWKRTLTPETAAEYAYIMEDIKGATEVEEKGIDNVGVKAIDEYTLQVELNRPLTYFPELMSFQIFFPQNKAFVESCGDSYGVTADKQLYNGPFVLSTWKMEDIFTMTKNSSYWDAKNVKLEKINNKVVKDTGADVNLYEDSQIDRVLLTSEYVDKYKDSPELGSNELASTFILQVNAGNHE